MPKAKNAILLHGSSGSPNSFWIPSIRRFLSKKGYAVWTPQLPDANTPSLSVQLPFILTNGTFNSSTRMVGHSSGCPLILGALETLRTPVRMVVLVAGFAQPLDRGPEPILKKKYDWKQIRRNARSFFFLNSDNDPWGCDDTQGRYMLDRLGGKLIVLHGEGHMGSDKFRQPYKSFPLLEKILELA